MFFEQWGYMLQLVFTVPGLNHEGKFSQTYENHDSGKN